MDSEARRRAQAVLFGATAAALRSGDGSGNGPPPFAARTNPRWQAPVVDSMAALLDPSADRNDPETRLARVSAASLLSTVRGIDRNKIKTLLGSDERDRLDDVYDRLRSHKKPHCRYCSFFVDLAYVGNHTAVPVAHLEGDHAESKIQTTFDPDTTISTAAITKFQFITKDRQSAIKVIDSANPLKWSANSLWDASLPVENDGKDWRSLGNRETLASWAGTPGDKYLFEAVTIPQTDELTGKVENVLRMGFPHIAEDNLEFNYTLERCCRSNFGISWETAGMDVDCGGYHGTTTPLKDVLARTSSRPNYSAIKATADTITNKGGHDVSQSQLVEISASKSLRFTVPKEGPAELSTLLNWTAPVFLFNFLNLSICQVPHLLAQGSD